MALFPAEQPKPEVVEVVTDQDAVAVVWSLNDLLPDEWEITVVSPDEPTEKDTDDGQIWS